MHFFQKKINSANEEYSLFTKCDKILVALSGGADSVSLLCSLVSFFPTCKLYACHVNHMLRGSEADRDEAFVRDICTKLGVTLDVLKIDVNAVAKQKKQSTELAARNIRYDFFKQVCRKHGIHLVATAHTASDNAETVIYNLARGTGLAGICGIPPKRLLDDEIYLIRPLIFATRAEVEAYLAELCQDYVTDSTNLGDDYTRNRIRHSIIPHLAEINPAFEEAVVNTVGILGDIQIFLEKTVNNSITDDVATLASLDDCILSAVIMKLYEKTGSPEQLGKVHVDSVAGLVKCYAGGRRDKTEICLPNKLSAIIRHGKLSFEPTVRKAPKSQVYYSLPLTNGASDIPDTHFSVEVCDGQKAKADVELFAWTYLDKTKISGTLYARNRRNGDKIFSCGMHKTVKSLFNEKQISQNIRGLVPFVCDDTGILFVPNVAVNDRHRQNGILPENRLRINIYLAIQSEQENI